MSNAQYVEENSEFSSFLTLKHKRMDFGEVIEDILRYTQEDPDKDYRIIIGTDSEGKDLLAYATAIVVHKVGHGGRAYVAKNILKIGRVLRDKILTETQLSLMLAEELVPKLTENLGEDFLTNGLEIHIDVGPNGETKDMIREVVGWVQGMGYQVGIKPDASAASTVADRFAVPPRTTEVEVA